MLAGVAVMPAAGVWYTESDGGGVRSMVLLPSRTTAVADGASETAVPDMLMAGPPGMSVWVPAMYCEAELRVSFVPGREMIGGGGWDGAISAGLPFEGIPEAAGLPCWPPGSNADGSPFKGGAGA